MVHSMEFWQALCFFAHGFLALPALHIPTKTPVHYLVHPRHDSCPASYRYAVGRSRLAGRVILSWDETVRFNVCKP